MKKYEKARESLLNQQTQRQKAQKEEPRKYLKILLTLINLIKPFHNPTSIGKYTCLIVSTNLLYLQ